MLICPDCRKPIGLMANMYGQPTTFLCPYSKAIVGPQEPPERKVVSKGKQHKKNKNEKAEIEAFQRKPDSNPDSNPDRQNAKNKQESKGWKC